MTEEFCEQCGQALVPNARFCAVCGWETGSQATLPLPQGLTGNYGGSGYPQQGAPTPLEEFEQEFERQSTYEPAYDPYDQYGNDSYNAGAYANDSGDHDSGKGSGKRGKKKRNSAKDKASGKGSKPAAAKRSTGKSTKKVITPNGAHDPGKSRKHPVTAIAIAILACIVVVFSGVGIVRMMASANNTISGSDASSSSSSSAGAKDETLANNSQNSTPVTDKTSKKATAQQQDTQPPADGRYLNARFGYAVTIPSGFTWQAESADGDGRTFTDDQTGMTIAAWGSNNALHETVISAFKQATVGHSVSYQQILDSEFTATWEENGTITYIREMVSAGAIRAVRFTYPSTHRNECDRFVEQVVPTLTATDAMTAGSGQ